MRFLPIVAIALGIAVLVAVLGRQGFSFAELSDDEIMRLVYLSILVLAIGSYSVASRGRWRENARNAALWVVIILGLVGGYLYRYELQDFGSRLSGGLIPGSPISGQTADGLATVTLIRGRDGHFHANGSVDGTPIRFLVDTGASVVVLTDADARRAGIDTDGLTYDVSVNTANGRTTAAGVRLDSLEIAGLTRSRVEAMVARPEALTSSLLGMSFLGSLGGVEIRGDRLVLTD